MSRKIITTFICFFCGSIMSPVFVLADVRINEIMYDVEGSDKGFEWIELYNDGDSSVDLGSWRFREADVNHKFDNPEGDLVLKSNEYVIVADDLATLVSIMPQNTRIFDSSFSLSNVGESISLIDGFGNVVDTINYSSDQGANGDGKSLQYISGDWIQVLPTPGKANVASSEIDIQNNVVNDEGDDVVDQDLKSGNVSGKSIAVIDIVQKIKTTIRPYSVVVAGAGLEFQSESIGLNGFALENEKYIWNFGDGMIGEGKSVYHTYMYPGNYVLVLDVSSGKYSASDRVELKVIDPRISINSAGADFVELRNDSSYLLDLSYWILESNAGRYVLPKNSFILAKSNVKYSISSTQDGIFFARLLFPNGEEAARWSVLEDAGDVGDTVFQVSGVSESDIISISHTNIETVDTKITSQKGDLNVIKSASVVDSQIVELDKPVYSSVDIKNISDLSTSTTALASVSNVPINQVENDQRTSGHNKYLAILGGVIFVGVASYLYLFRPNVENKLSADDFTIIDS